MPIGYPSGYDPATLIPQIAILVQLGSRARASVRTFKVALLGNKTSAGLATAETPTEVYSPTDAETQCGPRSELAAMCRAWFGIAPRARVDVVPVPENGSAVAATCTLAFSGTATASGAVRIRIAGRRMPEVAFASGATGSTIAAAVEAMLDLYTDLPCTAGSSTSTVTLTAAQGGPRGNDLRILCEIVPAAGASTGVTVALNGGSGARKVDGRFGAGSATAGSGADDFTAALAAILPLDYQFVVCAANDDTNRGLISAHVTAASGIGEGRRRAAVVASYEGTLSVVMADARAMNNARGQVIHLKGAHEGTGAMAAAYCAAHIYGDGRLKGIAQYTAAKQNHLSLAPAISAPEATDILTRTELDALLAAGVSPLIPSTANPGYAEVLRPVTTLTTALSGARTTAVIDPSKVRVADELAGRIEEFAWTAYADKNLAPNPTDPDAVLPAEVTYPAAIREDVLAIMRTMEGEGKLVDVARHASEVVVDISNDNNTVAVAYVPAAVIPHFHGFVVTVDQVG